eukprot:TRINITY_DN6496_c0_g1_i1.p1 TRINITY_DN6496_c0_g1~~TRINITY_DN6496_c0_g1_i1.p1  ORF type:complete len:463 (+),score=65.54 TRINITY_DN6496_c0_g1_i1:28-1389(+)
MGESPQHKMDGYKYTLAAGTALGAAVAYATTGCCSSSKKQEERRTVNQSRDYLRSSSTASSGFETEGSSSPSSPPGSPAARLPPHFVRETTSVEVIRDEEGNKSINQYLVISDIGQGAYGKVKLAYNDDTGDPVAIKIMQKSRVKAKYKREIAIMKKLNHPNLVRLHEVIDDETSEKVYLVLDHVENGPVASLLASGKLDKSPLPDKKLKRLLADVAGGLQYLHAQGVLHKDLKPDNLLESSDGRIKIADFGVSSFIHHQELRGNGTPAFSPPEALGTSTDVKIDPFAVDVWALGVTLFCLKYGELPFKGSNIGRITLSVHRDNLFGRDDEEEESEIAELLKRLLNKDPFARIKLDEVLAHPYLAGRGACSRDFSPINVTETEITTAVNKVVLMVKVKSMLRKRRLSASRKIASRSNSVSYSSLSGLDSTGYSGLDSTGYSGLDSTGHGQDEL